jgi:hypothetical protein
MMHDAQITHITIKKKPQKKFGMNNGCNKAKVMPYCSITHYSQA